MSSIAILTATRAEYGLLKPFIRALQEEGIETRVLVTGTHLSSFFGNTVNEIEADGIEIDEKIPILVDSDSPAGVSKTMALALWWRDNGRRYRRGYTACDNEDELFALYEHRCVS